MQQSATRAAQEHARQARKSKIYVYLYPFSRTSIMGLDIESGPQMRYNNLTGHPEILHERTPKHLIGLRQSMIGVCPNGLEKPYK
jgi:hypothetical protein